MPMPFVICGPQLHEADHGERRMCSYTTARRTSYTDFNVGGMLISRTRFGIVIKATPRKGIYWKYGFSFQEVRNSSNFCL